MILSPQDSETFFTLWSGIDAHVNARTNTLPGLSTPDQMRKTEPGLLARLRKHLWEHRELLDAFVEENPFSLSREQLGDAELFRHAVVGRFYVERCLKDHAVFVSGGKVYAVGGLTERIDAILFRAAGAKQALMVDATLVPFRGRIVWDGIVSLYNISFGPGTRRVFKDEYVRAKGRGELITSLDPNAVKPKPRVAGPDWSPVVDSIVATSNKLGKTNTSLQAASFRLLKISALLAQATSRETSGSEELSGLVKKAVRSIKELSHALQHERR
jgi:hypothetical protein